MVLLAGPSERFVFTLHRGQQSAGEEFFDSGLVMFYVSGHRRVSLIVSPITWRRLLLALKP